MTGDTDEVHQTIRAEIHGHEKYSDERWLGHQREHVMLDRATDVAAISLDKRIEALNEFRAQLSDQSKNFTTRDLHDKLEQDFNRRLGTLIDRIVLIEKGDVKQEGKGLGQASMIAAALAGLAAIGSLVSILAVVLALK